MTNSDVSDTMVVALPVAGAECAGGICMRFMVGADINDLVELWFSAYPDGVTADTTYDEEVADWEATFDGQFGRLIPEACIVAVDEVEIVGAVATVLDAPWDNTPPGPFIIELFVHPGWRRQRIAEELMLQALGALNSAGYSSAGLRVDVGNEPARRLYKKLGFVDWWC